jgi:hypothetical protein
MEFASLARRSGAKKQDRHICPLSIGEMEESDHHYVDIKASLCYHHAVRTTVTIEDDVAVRLEREQRRRRASFKDVLNEVLRAGLDAAERREQAQRTPFKTKGFDLGPSLVGSLDNVEEILSRAEGEDHR